MDFDAKVQHMKKSPKLTAIAAAPIADNKSAVDSPRFTPG